MSTYRLKLINHKYTYVILFYMGHGRTSRRVLHLRAQHNIKCGFLVGTHSFWCGLSFADTWKFSRFSPYFCLQLQKLLYDWGEIKIISRHYRKRKKCRNGCLWCCHAANCTLLYKYSFFDHTHFLHILLIFVLPVVESKPVKA